MGKNNINDLFDESVTLELNVAELYRIFHRAFPQDNEFWWKLFLEENNHAALIRSAKEIFLPAGNFPADLVTESLTNIKEVNYKLTKLITKFSHTPPSRIEAFNVALELELSAGEIHFQKFMEQDSSAQIDAVFKKLNKDDKNHAARIKAYMKDNGIQLLKEES